MCPTFFNNPELWWFHFKNIRVSLNSWPPNLHVFVSHFVINIVLLRNDDKVNGAFLHLRYCWLLIKGSPRWFRDSPKIHSSCGGSSLARVLRTCSRCSPAAYLQTDPSLLAVTLDTRERCGGVSVATLWASTSVCFLQSIHSKVCLHSH